MGELSGKDPGFVNALAVSGNVLYAGTTFEGVFRSADGLNWTPASKGLSDMHVYALAVGGSNLFAATRDGLCRSSDSGATWSSTCSDTITSTVYSVAMLGGHLFAGSGFGRGVFRSSDHGYTWTGSKIGLGDFSLIYTLGGFGPYLYAGTQLTGYRSADSGRSWTMMEGLPYDSQSLVDFSAHNGKLFFATLGAGVFRSLDSGESWSRVNTGLPDKARVYDLQSVGSQIFAAVGVHGVFRSADDGASWTRVGEPSNIRDCNSLAVAGSYLFTGTNNSVWRFSLSELAPVRPPFRRSQAIPGFGPAPGPILHPGARIAFTTVERGRVEIGVYDFQGRRVASLLDSQLDPGEHQVTLDAPDLSGSRYLLRLRTAGFTQARRIRLDR